MSKYASKEQRAECAGFDAGMNGSNEENTHFSFFGTPEETKAWEAGKKRGEQSKVVLDKVSRR